MPRILAIDWDRLEVRGVLVSSGPTGTSVAGAWAASLATSDAAGLSGKQIGARLATAMGQKPSGNVTTLVAVGRDNVQMKLMTLPPAPVDELPDMVRFQAEREFTALGGEAALDFIPLSGDATSPNQVLALALSSAGITDARELCEAVGVELARIPVRGCAAAALVSRARLVSANEVVLVVNSLIEEADLAVQVAETVLLLRTVRLPDPTQAEARQRALLGEIRRTMAAVRQQSNELQVARVVICGADGISGKSEGLAKELEVPVAMFDPTADAPAGLMAKGLAPETLARFSAVLGMALTEADRRAPVVDFANVRRKQESRRFGRVHALATAVAALVAVWFAAHMWHQYAEPGRELAELQNRIRDVEAQTNMYKKVTAQAAAVERWQATDVNWLDELHNFALRIRPQPLAAKDFPVANDAVITQLTLQRPPGQTAVGGKMDIQAVAKSPAAVAALEHRLRDGQRTVSTGGGKLEKSTPGYDWSFGLDVRVPPSSEETIAEAAKK
jgi:Tfp pilus assembly PilM family ATPase